MVSKFPAENGGVTTEFDESSSAVIYPKMVVAREAEPDKFLVNFGYFVGVTYKGDAAGVWASLKPGDAVALRLGRGRRIRGACASASLKHVVRVIDHHSVPRIRGACAPGSLKP